MEINELTKQVLQLKNITQPGETLEDVFKRVSKVIASSEKEGIREYWENQFFNIMNNGLFLPNFPTLRNAGRNQGNLAACNVISIEDSRESIFEALKQAVNAQAFGVGTGFDFSNLRPEGALIKSTGGFSSGVVSFIRIFDVTIGDVIKQGGIRAGACMGSLFCHHPDILKFIKAKEDHVIKNFNLSVMVTDEFMEKAEKGEDYDLIDPQTKKPIGKLNAGLVFQEMCKFAHKKGCPGILFYDAINVNSPEDMKITTTNPCVTSDTWLSTDRGWEQMGSLLGVGKLNKVAVDSRLLNNPAKDSSNVVESETVLRKPTSHGVFVTGKNEQIYKVTLANGMEIKCTKNHKLITDKLTKVPLESLNVGDALSLKRGEGPFGSNGNYEEGVIMGLLYSDGCINAEPNDYYDYYSANISIWNNDDDGLLENELLPYINYILNTSESSYGDLTVLYEKGKKHKYIKSRRLFNYLNNKYSCKEKINLNITPQIMMGSRMFLKGFLYGMVVGDGSYDCQGKRSQNCITISSISKDMLKKIQILLTSFGINSSIRDSHKEKTKSIKGVSYHCQRLYRLCINGGNIDLFVEKIGLCKKHMAKHKKFKKTHKTRYQIKTVSKIKSIEKLGKETVYNLTQPDGNTVIYNGMLSAQCSETPLCGRSSFINDGKGGAGEFCNLGSINLKRVFERGLDQDDAKFKELVSTCTRFLDNIIEVNNYTILPDTEYASKATRKIGLGIMGLADYLVMKGIVYDSEDGFKAAKNIMGKVTSYAIEYSEKLADEKGEFPFSKKYKYTTPRRNAQVTLIPPSGTISMIAQCSPGCEPYFSMVNYYLTGEKTKLYQINELFKKMCSERGIILISDDFEKILKNKGSIQKMDFPSDIKALFKVAHDITPKNHIMMQSSLQTVVEMSISKTVNLPKDCTAEDFANVYLEAWKLGCKGVAAYRDGTYEDQPIQYSSEKSEPTKKMVQPRPKVLKGETETFDFGKSCGKLYITMNYDETNFAIKEVFLSRGYPGGCDAAQTAALAITISSALKSGTEVTDLIKKLKQIKCGKEFFDGENGDRVSVFGCPHAIALALERFMDRHHKNKCPNCGGELIFQEGCYHCSSCEYGKCSLG
jgi:ribonucleoside-diphosphate reductase alpha chain